MAQKIRQQTSTILKSGKRLTETAFTTMDGAVSKAATEMDTYFTPLRTSVLTRFPILFALLTTLGVVTTFLALEKIIAEIAILDQHPVLMLILGVSILAGTGTLYKKLS